MMKNNFIKRIICVLTMSLSLLGMFSVHASAEWRQSNNNWYYYNNDGTLAKNTVIDGKYAVGADGSWLQNNYIPITVPSTWTRLANDGYVMRNKSVLVYEPRDLNGVAYDKALLDMGTTILNNKDNSNVSTKSVKYNGHIAMRYEYTINTNGKTEKNCFIVIVTTTRFYGFMLIGDNNYNFDLDKIDLEYTLNASLNL